MSGQISFNGAPVVGFGEETSARRVDRVRSVLLDAAVGVVAGAAIGRVIKRGVGTAVGAFTGGALLGTVAYIAEKPAASAPATGVGSIESAAAMASPWPTTIATSVVGAATSWGIEEFVRSIRRRKRR